MNPHTNSVFQEPWWLEAVAPGQWQEAIVTQGDQTLARMPYVIKKRFGLTHIIMPPLTQTLGPWLVSSNSKYSKQLSQEKELMNAIIDQLPAFDYFYQNFHYSITNWLPFYWKSFSQTTRYTYLIEDLTDIDKVWSQFRRTHQQGIRKARKILFVYTDENIEKFIDLNELIFKKQGMELPYTREFVRRLDKACVQHNARQIFFAADGKGRLHGALYMIWDNREAHGLMLGNDPSLRESQAQRLLIFEAIKFASTVTKKFNFMGSMIEPIEQFLRGFGGAQKPYFSITKSSPRMKVFSSLQKIRQISFKN